MKQSLRWMQLVSFVPFTIGANNRCSCSKMLTAFSIATAIVASVICTVSTMQFLTKYNVETVSYAQDVHIEDIIRVLQLVAITFLYLVSHIECLLTLSAHISFCDHLMAVDHELQLMAIEHSFPRASTRSNIFASLASVQLICIVCLYVLPQVVLLFVIDTEATVEMGLVEFTWRLLVPHLMASLRCGQFIIYTAMLAGQLAATNAMFRQLHKMRAPKKLHLDMRRFCELHDRTMAMMSALSTAFGWTILLTVCHDFISIGAWIFVSLFKTVSWQLMASITVLVAVANVLGVTFAGQSLVTGLKQSTRLGLQMEEQMVAISSQQLNLFSLKISHQNQVFCGLGFFTIDLTLLQMVIAWISTFLIVCIQFLAEALLAKSEVNY